MCFLSAECALCDLPAHDCFWALPCIADRLARLAESKDDGYYSCRSLQNASHLPRQDGCEAGHPHPCCGRIRLAMEGRRRREAEDMERCR